MESGTGCGTTVKVRLDVELAEVQPEKKIEFLSEDEILRILGGKRVLLVEDHPMNIEVAKAYFRKAAYGSCVRRERKSGVGLIHGA